MIARITARIRAEPVHFAYIAGSIILLGIVTFLVMANEDDDLTGAVIVAAVAAVLRAGEWMWLRELRQEMHELPDQINKEPPLN